MDLGHLIILIVVLGLVWWGVTTFIPMPPAGKQVLTIAIVAVLILALLSFFGIFGAGVMHYRPG